MRRNRTAGEILRDIVEARLIAPDKDDPSLANEAKDYVDREYAARLAAKRAEREENEARKRRAQKAKERLGKFEIAPKVESGVDHSATGIVLLRRARDNSRLVWRSGAKYWSARSQAYAPAELEILWSAHGSARPETQLLTDNRKAGRRARLTPILIYAHHRKIDEVFGDDAWKRAIRAHENKETAVL
jgi:hypothetical protein